METLLLQGVSGMSFYHHFIVEIDAIFTFPDDSCKIDESFVSIGHPMNEGHIGMRL